MMLERLLPPTPRSGEVIKPLPGGGYIGYWEDDMGTDHTSLAIDFNTGEGIMPKRVVVLLKAIEMVRNGDTNRLDTRYGDKVYRVANIVRIDISS